jgi:type I restriction enzyme, S subunit
MELKSGFKLTEVGAIPDTWDVVALDSCVRSGAPICYGILMPGAHSHGGVPVVKVRDIVNGRVEEGELLLTQRSIDEAYRRSRLIEGDLLVTIRGTTGRIALVSSRLNGANITQDTARVRVVDGVDPLFVYFALQSEPLQHQIALHTIGQAVRGINIRDVRNLALALPRALAEQRVIAAALRDVDALLEGLTQLIAKKRDLKQAAMQQLLTGQTRLPRFHGEWKVKWLGEVATFHKGKGLPKSALTPYGSQPCIHYGELFTQYGETIHETFSRTNRSAGEFRSIANDVLMPTSDVTPRGLAKASCISVDGVVLGGDILVIRTDPAYISGTFLSYVIRREEDQVLRLVTGTTVFHLYGANMKEFTARFPPLAEQQAIVAVFSDMDAELAALEARRDKTRALKQAMMQELLTGRTRLI